MARRVNSCIVQVIGMILASVAMVLCIVVCAMPHWKVSILMESNAYGKRIDGHWISRWDGLWLTCIRQTNNPLSCQPYSTSILITSDLKASRILMTFAVLFAIFGFLNAVTGMWYNNCCKKNKWNQNCLMLTAGITFIMAGIFVLISVTWTASNVMRNVCFSYCKSVQQQEIGEAIFLGWPTVLFFFIGGSIFCWYHPCSCRQRKDVRRVVVNDIEREHCHEGNLLARELQTYSCNRSNCSE